MGISIYDYLFKQLVRVNLDEKLIVCLSIAFYFALWVLRMILTLDWKY